MATRRPVLWHVGDVVVDLESQRVFRQDMEIVLRPKVWAMLSALLRKPDAVVSARDLMAAIWPNQDIDPKLLVNLASELRRQLGSAQTLRSVPRRGYVLEAQPVSAGVQGGSHPASSLGFIGRETTLGQLLQSLHEVKGGRPALVDVVGQPGVGKTCLVSQLIAKVNEGNGVLVLHGGAVDLIGEREPFGVLLQMLQDHLSQAPATSQIEDLKRLAPCWLAQLPGLVDQAELASLRHELRHSSEGRMRREFTQLVRHWAKAQTVVMVLEDLHWADVSTLDWLESLSQSSLPASILVITTRRPPAHTPQGKSAGVIGRARWMSAEGVKRIELMGFGVDETRYFLQERLPASMASGELATQLHRITGGLPLMLELACRDAETTHLSDGLSLEQLVEQESRFLQSRLRHWILKRIHQLPDTQIKIVQLVSCAPMAWPLALIAHALDMSVMEAHDLADRLVTKGVFKAWTGTSPWDSSLTRLCDFTHHMYRETVHDSLSEELRQALCGKVASMYLQSTRTLPPNVTPHMALMLSKAGLHAEAARAMRAQSAHALDRFSPHHAIQAMNSAVAELERTPRSIERLTLQLEMYWNLEAIQSLVRDHAAPEVLAMKHRMIELAAEIQTPRARLISRITRLKSAFFQYNKSPEEASVIAAAMVEDVGEVSSQEQEIVWFWAGLTSTAQARLLEARLRFERCLEVVHQDPGDLLSEYRLLAEATWIWCLGLTGDLARFASQLTRVEHDRRAGRNTFLLTHALFTAADALRQLGCHAAAKQRYTEMIALCERHDQRLLKSEGLAGAQACLPASERDLVLLYRLVRSSEYGRHTAVMILVETLLDTQRTDEAAKVMADASLVEIARHAYTRNAMLRFQGDLLAHGDRHEVAVELWLKALEADLQHRYLPGVIESLKRLHIAKVRLDAHWQDLTQWADQIDHSLASASDLDALGLANLDQRRLRPMLVGFQRATEVDV